MTTHRIKPLAIAFGLVLAGALIAEVLQSDQPVAAPSAPAVTQAPDGGWQPAAGNLWPGTRLYFGQHEKMYRGEIVRFVETSSGEAVVLINDGTIEVVRRQFIVHGDFWVRRE